MTHLGDVCTENSTSWSKTPRFKSPLINPQKRKPCHDLLSSTVLLSPGHRAAIVLEQVPQLLLKMWQISSVSASFSTFNTGKILFAYLQQKSKNSIKFLRAGTDLFSAWNNKSLSWDERKKHLHDTKHLKEVLIWCSLMCTQRGENSQRILLLLTKMKCFISLWVQLLLGTASYHNPTKEWQRFGGKQRDSLTGIFTEEMSLSLMRWQRRVSCKSPGEAQLCL